MIHHFKSKHIDDELDLRKSTYHDGTDALVGFYTDGSGESETLSLNLMGLGMSAPDGHYYVGDYSQHEGIAQALVGLGLAEIVEWVSLPPHGARAALVKVVDGVDLT